MSFIVTLAANDYHLQTQLRMRLNCNQYCEWFSFSISCEWLSIADTDANASH